MKCFNRRIFPFFFLLAVGFFAIPKCVVGAPVYSQVLPEEPVGAFTSQEGPFA